jgi:hypothetical protein
MHFKIMAAAALSVLAAPVFAQNNDATVAPKPEKKVCRRVEVTGSIIGSKAVCHTKAEWTAIDDANAKAAGDSLARQRDTRLNRPEG